MTDGSETCVLSCGLLVSWLELWKGESLQLVYALLRSVVAVLRVNGINVKCVFYDNACKLLSAVKASVPATCL